MTNKTFYMLVALATLLVIVAMAIPIIAIILPTAPPASTALTAESTPVPETQPEPIVIGDSYREMRGLWIPTVNNNIFPSKAGLSKPKLESELDSIVTFAKDNGFNTILFQVRPEADALYRSELFPASRVVSGECGKNADGELDCLAYLLEKAHANNIKVHAWVNPLRVATSDSVFGAIPETSPVAAHPECVVKYADGKYYFDAGQPFVRELVALGVREICENYDVDGIVFDDYFYPYPTQNNDRFNDENTFAMYGDGMTLEDFRRDSVNKLIKSCFDTVKSIDSEIEFGVSPFGIWQNYDGSNGGSATKGLQAYHSIYCDALAWANGGYVDYLAPQIYWSFDKAAAPFGVLAEWWSRALDGTGVHLYINHGVYKYDEGDMQSGEMAKQIEFSRGLYSYRGGMYFGYKALVNNTKGVLDEIKADFDRQAISFEYTDNGHLTVDSYKNGDTAPHNAIISGKSNCAYPISVNGITPLRYRDGSYSITLSLIRGDNLVTVINGNERIEIVLKY